MNAFDSCREIEAKAWREIQSLVQELSFGTAITKFNDQNAQREGYDVLAPKWKYANGECRLELKAELDNPRDNLFLETWSNKSFGKQKEGWMLTMKADWLLYYFINDKRLLLIPCEPLWLWFFGNNGFSGWHPQYAEYRQVAQAKSDQKNITCGHLVPIEDIYRYVRFVEFNNRNGWELDRDFDAVYRPRSGDKSTWK